MTQSAEADPAVALGLAVALDVRKAGEQPCDRDPALEARHAHPGARVIAVAEGEMTIRLARDVEAVGCGEPCRIAIGRTDAQRDEGARRKRAVDELDLAREAPVVQLQRALVAQHLLDQIGRASWRERG